MNMSLKRLKVYTLAIAADGSVLYAGTDSGVFSLKLSS